MYQLRVMFSSSASGSGFICAQVHGEGTRSAAPTLRCSSVDLFGSECFQMLHDLCRAYCSFKQAVTTFKCMRVCVYVCINAQTAEPERSNEV